MSSACKGTDCSTSQEIHLNDIGTIFRITVNDCVSGVTTPLDVSSATTKEIVFRSPAGVVKTKTAVNTTDGTNGQIQYTSASGDFDEIGHWKVQARITLSSPAGTWRSDIGSFRVYENL